MSNGFDSVQPDGDRARPSESPVPERKDLPPAAKRALREAEERRRAAAAQTKPGAREVGGREGPDPVRYGDWEKGGIVSDF